MLWKQTLIHQNSKIVTARNLCLSFYSKNQTSLELSFGNEWVITPLFKSNRNLLSGVKLWYLFSMYRFEIFHAARWGLLHSLWKISWVYVIAERLCEHSNLVMFEKRAAKTLQHGYRYGDILMLYDIITTYEWFFCYNWHKLCSSNKLLDFSSIYNFLVKYAI